MVYGVKKSGLVPQVKNIILYATLKAVYGQTRQPIRLIKISIRKYQQLWS